MVKGLAKAVLCGNLTRDPEVRTTPNGASVTSFGVAVNRSYKGSDGATKEEVSFFDVTAWGKGGEIIAKYAKKGTPMLISGRLAQRSWDDKNGGGKRSRVEIVMEDFNFLGGGDGDSAGGYSQGAGASAGAKNNKESDVVPDDIPVEEGDVNLDDIPF